MFCEHCEVGDYHAVCMCLKSKEVCPFVRRCNTEYRWKPLDSMSKCSMRKEDIVLNKDECKVRFEKDGNLYIEIGDRVIIKKNPYDYTPEKIEMIRVDNELYVKGFEPKVESLSEDLNEDKPVIKKKNQRKVSE